jgi:cyclopropane fatty-acyl-phospholipid synthase-like methyltransferase
LKRRAFLAAGIAAAVSGCSTAELHKVAPYVPTPWPVVDAMLQLAAVRKDDVVYDLGCGDGRIVISAARYFGARGVGVDIDPHLIYEANASARAAGVSERTRFSVQDLFQTDFSEASVITLYLYPDMNAKLLPRFRSELRPGTRIVSHRFRIGDWEPARIEAARFANRSHPIFLWIVPQA